MGFHGFLRFFSAFFTSGYNSDMRYLYEKTSGYINIGTNRNLSVVSEVQKGSILLPAENENEQQLNYFYKTYWFGSKRSITYLPVKTEEGEFGYIESSACDLITYYYSPNYHHELYTSICENIQTRYHLPQCIAEVCYKMYRKFDFDTISYYSEDPA